MSAIERPLGAKIVLVAIYTLSMLLSFSGNVLAIWVLMHGNRWRLDLNVFLISLAVSDICIALFCMPFTFIEPMMGRWVFTHSMCPFVLFMQHMAVISSVITNMAIGLDRYWAVEFPLRARFTHRRARFIVTIIWFFSFAVASVQLVVSRTVRDELGLWSCRETWTGYKKQVYTILSFVLLYVLPLLILCATYMKISIKLWHRKTPGNPNTDRDTHAQRSKEKVIRMLVAIVIVFATCWLPLHIFVILNDFPTSSIKNLRQTERGETVFNIWYFISHWLAMSHSFVNPIIYTFLNENFRDDLRGIIPCFRTHVYNLPQSRTTSFHSIHSNTSYNRGGGRNDRRPTGNNSPNTADRDFPLMVLTTKINSLSVEEISSKI